MKNALFTFRDKDDYPTEYEYMISIDDEYEYYTLDYDDDLDCEILIPFNDGRGNFLLEEFEGKDDFQTALNLYEDDFGDDDVYIHMYRTLPKSWTSFPELDDNYSLKAHKILRLLKAAKEVNIHREKVTYISIKEVFDRHEKQSKAAFEIANRLVAGEDFSKQDQETLSAQFFYAAALIYKEEMKKPKEKRCSEVFGFLLQKGVDYLEAE